MSSLTLVLGHCGEVGKFAGGGGAVVVVVVDIAPSLRVLRVVIDRW